MRVPARKMSSEVYGQPWQTVSSGRGPRMVERVREQGVRDEKVLPAMIRPVVFLSRSSLPPCL